MFVDPRDRTTRLMPFYIALIVWTILTAIVWWRSDRRAGRLRDTRGRRVGSTLLRLVLGAFYLAALAYPAVLLTKPILEREPDNIPPVLVTLAFLWHPGVLSLALCNAVLLWVGRRIMAWRRRTKAIADTDATPSDPASASPPPSGLTRRQALGLVAAAVPPVIGTGLTAAAFQQRGRFRTRHLELWFPTLPADLDRLRLVHVTDLHAGNFFPPESVDAVVAEVHRLAPELVVFTGDLIDRGLLDRMPTGFRYVDAMRRYPFAMIEGNHDVQGNAAEFERISRDATKGWPNSSEQPTLLLDEQKLVYPRGRAASPVQLLGITWGELRHPEADPMEPDPARFVRKYGEAYTADAVRKVAALPRPAGAFPILLAHHPHAFDAAVEANLPLTLAGHTHGGQIMLTESIGAGPMRFRYWAGEHERNGCRMVISNGLGSWFPLRVGAAAELLHITLRAGNGKLAMERTRA